MPHHFVPALCSGISIGILTFLVMKKYDVYSPLPWNGVHSSGIVFSCALFLGLGLGGIAGLWMTVYFWMDTAMYAPLEGAISGAVGGCCGATLIGGWYAVRAAQR